MEKSEHLMKEVSQAGTGADNLAVYEGVGLTVVIHIVGMAEGIIGTLGMCWV